MPVVGAGEAAVLEDRDDVVDEGTVHVHRLRRKIGPYRDRIVTVRRLGYIYTSR